MKQQWENFCQLIVAGKSKIQAYLDAGYECKRATASTNARRLYANATIQARIAELKREAAERASVTIDMVVDELKSIAFTEITAGNPVRVNDKLNALNQLGNYLGMYQGKGANAIDVSSLVEKIDQRGQDLVAQAKLNKKRAIQEDAK